MCACSRPCESSPAHPSSTRSGRTVGEISDALSAEHGERFAKIAAVSSFVVNGDRASRDTLIADGDEVAILPPVSGG